ncbi:hypothetical protein SprV_0401488800 [Sparganum proliferum]
MLMDVYRDERPGIRIAYGTDGHLLNQRWMRHQSRLSTTTVHELLFADDCALNTITKEDMQRKDILKSSLKRLQINLANWEDLDRDRRTWRRTFKTGAAIYEASRIAAAKAKRETRKSQLRQLRNANAQPPPMCPRCQRTFQVPIGIVGHLRINCTTPTAPTVVPASTISSTPSFNSDHLPEPPLSSPTSSFFSSSFSPFSFSSSSSSPLPPPPPPQRLPLWHLTCTSALHTILTHQ